MPFVLDNSVVTGWYIGAQATDYTQSIATRLETDRAVVPALWQLEFTNVLKTACTRGKLSLGAARDIVAVIDALPIDIDAGTTPGPRQLLEIAMRYDLSSYAATYLELALRSHLPIASQDTKLRAAALQAGLVVL